MSMENHEWETLANAAVNGDSESIRAMIASGVDINAKNYQGWTPLMNAIDADSIEAVKTLIECGAEIEVKSEDGDTPLMFATRFARMSGDLTFLNILTSFPEL